MPESFAAGFESRGNRFFVAEFFHHFKKRVIIFYISRFVIINYRTVCLLDQPHRIFDIRAGMNDSVQSQVVQFPVRFRHIPTWQINRQIVMMFAVRLDDENSGIVKRNQLLRFFTNDLQKLNRISRRGDVAAD